MPSLQSSLWLVEFDQNIWSNGAVRYGVYTTALRILVPDESVMSFQLLFGYIGLLNALVLLPVLLILVQTAPQVGRQHNI